MNKIKKFCSDWKNGKTFWSSNNFEDVQLGKAKQYQWYTCSLSAMSRNFTFYNWFFGIGIGWTEFFLLPTIRFIIHPRQNKKEDFTITLLWINVAICLHIGHWLFCPFKGYKSQADIASYKQFQKEMEDNSKEFQEEIYNK